MDRPIDRSRRTVDRFGRPTGMHEVSVGLGRLTGQPSGWVYRLPGRPQANLGESASPFMIHTSFLNWNQIQLGFLKPCDSLAINKGVEPHELYPL